MEFEYKIGEKIKKIKVENDVAFLDDDKFSYSAQRIDANLISVIIDGSVHRGYIFKKNSDYFVTVDGEYWEFSEYDPFAEIGSEDEGETSKTITAPMPGKVVKVFVKSDDKVKKDARLMIIESMKMETEIFSQFDGEIEVCDLKEGEQFNQNDILIKFK